MRRILVAAIMVAVGATPVAAQVSEDTATAVAARFMDRLKAGEFAAAGEMVSPSVRDRLGGDQLTAIWAQVKAGLGDLNGTRPRSVAAVDTLQAVELIGDFVAQPMLLRVVVNPAKEIVGFWIGALPPEQSSSGPPYADATKFREEDAQVGADPWVLPATLTLPAGDGRFPAVVLVHGSGPQDRDETVGGTKVFRDLAHGLATRGIAVLRYEKRTKQHGARMTASTTVDEETVEDAVAGLAMLRTHPSVDPARVFLLGHSLGGQLGPEIVQRDGRAAGAVLMAAPGRPVQVLIREQLEYLRTLPVNAGADAQAQIAAVVSELDRLEAGNVPDTATMMGAPVSYFRDLQKRDGVAVATQLRVPMLILQGERDYQVTMEDFAVWQRALSARPGVTLKSFPGLNHLFVAGTGPSMPAEYATAGHVAEEVVTTIAAWVRQQGRPAGR